MSDNVVYLEAYRQARRLGAHLDDLTDTKPGVDTYGHRTAEALADALQRAEAWAKTNPDGVYRLSRGSHRVDITAGPGGTLSRADWMEALQALEDLTT